MDGACATDGQVVGTYLHGLFDAPEALSAWLRWAGLHDAAPLDLPSLREASIDRLADAVEQHLDTHRLASLMGLHACTP
jgi:adenosylcobyric acid synthase